MNVLEVLFLVKATPSKKTLLSTWAISGDILMAICSCFSGKRVIQFICPDSLRTKTIKELFIQNIYWGTSWRKIGRKLEEHRKIMSCSDV